MVTTIRATLHHGDVYQVTDTVVSGEVGTGDVVRALESTAYGTTLQWDSKAAHDILDDLTAGRPTGRGWVHLELV